MFICKYKNKQYLNQRLVSVQVCVNCLKFPDIYKCSSPLLPQVMGVLTN